MAAGQVCAVFQLPPAGLGIAGGDLRAGLLGHEVEELLAHVHAHLVLLHLVAVGAGDAATARVALPQVQPRDQGQDLQGRFADPVGPVLAGGVVGEHQGLPVRAQGAEVGGELALGVELPQPLEDVPGGLFQGLAARIFPVQELRGLLLQGQGAAGAGAHDGVTGQAEARQPGHVAPVIALRGVELAVGEHGQAAAVLGRDQHLVAVGFQDHHRGLADEGLVVLGGAAVEVDHLLLRAQPAMTGAFHPGAEGALGAPAGQGRFPGDAHHFFRQHPAHRVVEGQVGQVGGEAPGLAQELVSAQEAVAQGDALLRHHLGPGLGVDLRDAHARGADLVADPAAGAVVHRVVRRVGLAVLPEALGLGPGVLGAGEEVRHLGHRAVAGADVALDALVQGELHRVPGKGVHGQISLNETSLNGIS